jgi:hypothetical protein
MKLPNGHRADLGTKLEEYTLNSQHPQGKHKALVFDSALGITLQNADVLRKALLNAAASSDAAVARGDNGFGAIYELRFPVETDEGNAIVLTGWIILHTEDFPRLTTCYII